MTSLNPPCWIVSSSGANKENTEKQPVGKYIANVRRTHWYSSRYIIKVKLSASLIILFIEICTFFSLAYQYRNLILASLAISNTSICISLLVYIDINIKIQTIILFVPEPSVPKLHCILISYKCMVDIVFITIITFMNSFTFCISGPLTASVMVWNLNHFWRP